MKKKLFVGLFVCLFTRLYIIYLVIHFKQPLYPGQVLGKKVAICENLLGGMPVNHRAPHTFTH